MNETRIVFNDGSELSLYHAEHDNDGNLFEFFDCYIFDYDYSEYSRYSSFVVRIEVVKYMYTKQNVTLPLSLQESDDTEIDHFDEVDTDI